MVGIFRKIAGKMTKPPAFEGGRLRCATKNYD